MIVSVHAPVDGRYNAGMVIADDGIHVKRHGARSPDIGPRVLDGNSDRRRQRTAIVTGRHYDGPNRPKNVRVFDRADNASRLDIDTDRSAGKDVLFFHRREIDRNALKFAFAIGKRVVVALVAAAGPV